MRELGGQVVHICRSGGKCKSSDYSNHKNDYHDVVLDIKVDFPASKQVPESSTVIIEALRRILARVSVTEIENVHIVSSEMFSVEAGGFSFHSNVKIRVEGQAHASHVHTSVSNSMSTQVVRLLSLSLFPFFAQHLILQEHTHIYPYRVKHVVCQHLMQQNSCTT